ncbi:MAG: NADH-quinone oxidoreductase subunit C [Bacteroidetes bacterium]|nr:NADH-quinone oxidoreductase subunit C [Bacteroidota bacterium]
MQTEALQKYLEAWEFELTFGEETDQFLNVNVHPHQLLEFMRKLKSDPETYFDYLFCLTAVDWESTMEVVYHLESTKHRHILVVRTKTDERATPVLDSVSNIWATAEFHEREAFDFFGIHFKDHPNLKRLFLTEDWKGYPLRKDYTDEANMVIK